MLRVGAIREVCRRELSAGPCRWNREDEGVKLRLRHSPERTRLVLVTVPRQKSSCQAHIRYGICVIFGTTCSG